MIHSHKVTYRLSSRLFDAKIKSIHSHYTHVKEFYSKFEYHGNIIKHVVMDSLNEVATENTTKQILGIYLLEKI